MIRIWGRANSINVQKVLWACEEMGVPFERIDAGMQFGVNNTPEFLAMNPNGLVPVLQEDDFTLWESHAILRYLAMKHGRASLYPDDPRVAAKGDQWLEWCASTAWPFMKPVFWNLVRVPEPDRDMNAVRQGVEGLVKSFAILEDLLARQPYLAGDAFSLADIPLGLVAYRWYGLDIDRPDYPAVRAWFDRLTARRAFQKHCALKLT